MARHLAALALALPLAGCAASAPPPVTVIIVQAPAAAAAPVQAVAEAPRTIHVVSATYGRVCGVEGGNATAPIREACDGQARCDFLVNNRDGDPAPGCPKDFDVVYRCGDGAGQRSARHPALRDEGYTVHLACE